MKKDKNKTKTKERAGQTIDASGETLGRVASRAAMHLMGKTAATFERHRYSGFPVKIVNAAKIRITQKKLENIFHKRYSGIPGGLRVTPAAKTKTTKGMREVVRLVIYQMLPGNKLRREMMKNLVIED